MRPSTRTRPCRHPCWVRRCIASYYHYCWEAVAAEVVRVAKEDTKTNLADLFTKVLPRQRREELLDRCMYWIWSGQVWVFTGWFLSWSHMCWWMILYIGESIYYQTDIKEIFSRGPNEFRCVNEDLYVCHGYHRVVWHWWVVSESYSGHRCDIMGAWRLLYVTQRCTAHVLIVASFNLTILILTVL